MAESSSNDQQAASGPGSKEPLRRDKGGNTPLHVAARSGNSDVIKALLELEGDLEGKNALGQTALYLAVSSGNKEAVKCLLEVGADPTTVADDGSTIWHAAAFSGDSNVIGLLTVAVAHDTIKNDILSDEEECRISIESLRGEFKFASDNQTMDETKQRFNINNNNILMEKTSDQVLSCKAKVIRFNNKATEDCPEKKISNKATEEFKKSPISPEKRTVSAWENIYRKAEQFNFSSDSEEEENIKLFNKNNFSHFQNHIPPNEFFSEELDEDDPFLEVNEIYDFENDEEEYHFEKQPNDNNEKYTMGKNSMKKSSNIENGVNGQLPTYFEKDHKVCHKKSEEKCSETKNIIDGSNLLEVKQKSKKKRQRKRKKQSLTSCYQTDKNNSKTNEKQPNGCPLKHENNGSYIGTDNNEAGSDESVIFIDLTAKSNQSSSSALNSSSSKHEINMDSDSVPRSIKINQRRNRKRRSKNQSKETICDKKKEEKKIDCERLMMEAHFFVRKTLFFFDLMLGPSRCEKMLHERIRSIERDFLDEHANEADVNSTDDEGRTVLHHAALAGASRAVERLLENGANVNLPDRDRITPMLFAAFGGSPKVVELLARSGGKCYTTIPSTWETPLHIAAKRDDHLVVEKLLQLGAQPNATDRQNRTPLQVALSNGATASGPLLMEHGASLQH